jgi:hypothetical protein
MSVSHLLPKSMEKPFPLSDVLPPWIFIFETYRLSTADEVLSLRPSGSIDMREVKPI